jgi:hypothetical protein
MMQMYNSLVKYLMSSDIGRSVEINFIDVTDGRIREYPYALSILLKGYAIPLVAIDGIVRYYGGINYEEIYNEVRKLLL